MFNICQRISEIKSIINDIKSQGKAISLIPTMGSLHEGHLKLIAESKLKSDFIIVSIFINSKQFNRKEDYNKYPRNLDDDLESMKLGYRLNQNGFVNETDLEQIILSGKSKQSCFNILLEKGFILSDNSPRFLYPTTISTRLP